MSARFVIMRFVVVALSCFQFWAVCYLRVAIVFFNFYMAYATLQTSRSIQLVKDFYYSWPMCNTAKSDCWQRLIVIGIKFEVLKLGGRGRINCCSLYTYCSIGLLAIIIKFVISYYLIIMKTEKKATYFNLSYISSTKNSLYCYRCSISYFETLLWSLIDKLRIADWN